VGKVARAWRDLVSMLMSLVAVCRRNWRPLGQRAKWAARSSVWPKRGPIVPRLVCGCSGQFGAEFQRLVLHWLASALLHTFSTTAPLQHCGRSDDSFALNHAHERAHFSSGLEESPPNNWPAQSNNKQPNDVRPEQESGGKSGRSLSVFRPASGCPWRAPFLSPFRSGLLAARFWPLEIQLAVTFASRPLQLTSPIIQILMGQPGNWEASEPFECRSGRGGKRATVARPALDTACGPTLLAVCCVRRAHCCTLAAD